MIRSRGHNIRACLAIITILSFSLSSLAQTRILFDAKKGEMAGNADWVIDADVWNVGVGVGGAYTSSSAHKSNPQQTPTPSQSGITGSTPETYWNGGISAWGVDCAKRGYIVESLPWNGEISYGNATNPQDLSNYDVYIIDEPNLLFTYDEKTAILQFVQNGGGLFIIADHNASDRNGDGWDSPNIWNDFFSTNSIAANPFGITFDLSDFSQTTTNISASATDPIIHGPMGNVTQAQWAGGTTMTLNTASNPTIKGVIFKTGATAGSSNVMVAYGRYGNGKIAAMGDSSPTDDGTGNPDCTLYDGYFNDAAGNHQLLIMNITIWLATHAAGEDIVSAQQPQVAVYPNPSTNEIFLSSTQRLTNVTAVVYTAEGMTVFSKSATEIMANEKMPLQLSCGQYFTRLTCDQGTFILRFAIIK